ncbi:hypothetical protein PoB_005187200 [Plakobranchus ocellatus]|uniref:Uncharacterized protein n=1 Tax=Plakobranchus ocellatus TaxID=259542 RepID=A0AAV4C268_9GAST|nr:hypothetical protein PoB_005187200 [Plakobranchus ocellatus]
MSLVDLCGGVLAKMKIQRRLRIGRDRRYSRFYLDLPSVTEPFLNKVISGFQSLHQARASLPWLDRRVSADFRMAATKAPPHVIFLP